MKMETTIDASKSCSKLKTDWYQTDSHVIITIFLKNAQSENVNIDFEEKEIKVVIKTPDTDHIKNYHLWHHIRPAECLYKVYSTKIEIKLKKKEGLRWNALEGEGPPKDIKVIEVPGVGSEHPPQYPSSSVKKKDWNKLEAEVKKLEEKEKPEGDAALNQLFQKIYSDGDEEVKRAMNKSFMESGGTVLSTNWKEVGEKLVDVKAPDGMEWKKWEN